jgi:hypothetical protein
MIRQQKLQKQVDDKRHITLLEAHEYLTLFREGRKSQGFFPESTLKLDEKTIAIPASERVSTRLRGEDIWIEQVERVWLRSNNFHKFLLLLAQEELLNVWWEPEVGMMGAGFIVYRGE